MIMWSRKTPSKVAPIPASAFRDGSFRAWVLNSTRLAPSVSNACPADLQSAVLGHDRQVPAAADGAPAGAIDRGERPLDPGFLVGQGGLDPAAEARLVLRTHDRPAPDREIERDEREIGEVIEPEWLETDPRPLEHDRLDPRLRWHGPDGSGHEGRAMRPDIARR
jgi:hypothetical protein